MSKNFSKVKDISLVIIALLLAYFSTKNKLVILPDQNMLIDSQWNLFTVCSVFAGFSFTVLGLLLGMNSESLIKKLKNTTIIAEKSRYLMSSVYYFCISGVISLCFVIRIDTLLNEIVLSFVDESLISISAFLYLCGMGFLIEGIVYFMVSIVKVYDLIKRVYGYDERKYTQMKKDFEEAISRKEQD